MLVRAYAVTDVDRRNPNNICLSLDGTPPELRLFPDRTDTDFYNNVNHGDRISIEFGDGGGTIERIFYGNRPVWSW